jgi:flagellar basal-body rod protein FlgB
MARTIGITPPAKARNYRPKHPLFKGSKIKVILIIAPRPQPTEVTDMLANLTNGLDFQAKALVIRADRQRVIASNIANADTPGYAGRDINFKEAMNSAMGNSSALTLAPSGGGSATDGTSHSQHIPLQSTLGSLGGGNGPALEYTVQSQPAMDANSVDMDRERANFVDNAVRYEATLRFINGASRTILSAIQGQ